MQRIAQAFHLTWLDLKSNRYATFYIPSIVISILFLPLYGGVHFLDFLTSLLHDIPIVGKYISLVINELLSFITNFLDFLFSFLLVTALSPVNAKLSEKMEQDTTSNTYSSGVKIFFKNIIRIVLIFLFLGLTSFIFGNIVKALLKVLDLQLLDAPISVLLSAFFYGWAFMDYSLERRSYNLEQTRIFVSSYWKECLCIGIVFLVLFKIPYLGLLIAPIVTTMFATHLFLGITKN